VYIVSERKVFKVKITNIVTITKVRNDPVDYIYVDENEKIYRILDGTIRLFD
jgi:hypothetical protein